MRVSFKASPAPWRYVATPPIGGIYEVGFGDPVLGELLLVVTADGRGLVDCATGQVVARDRAGIEEDWYDPDHLVAVGIGPLASVAVSVAGLHGGTLTQHTADGWSVSVVDDSLDDRGITLVGPDGATTLDCPVAGEVRAAGFSPSGHSLVLAESAGLFLFSRAP